MKRWTLFFMLVVMSASLVTSCGPDARYPIDAKPEVKVDKRLYGKWIITEKKGSDVLADSDIVYTVSKENEYQYRVLIRAKKADKYEEDTTIAYLSKIDKQPFLNIYQKGDPGGYIFLKILKIGADTVFATSLADTMVATNAAQVRALITTNLKNPDFYKDTVAFDRVK